MALTAELETIIDFEFSLDATAGVALVLVFALFDNIREGMTRVLRSDVSGVGTGVDVAECDGNP